MMDNAIELFTQVVTEFIPYAFVWIIGSWLVNTLMSWVTGRGWRL